MTQYRCILLAVELNPEIDDLLIKRAKTIQEAQGLRHSFSPRH